MSSIRTHGNVNPLDEPDMRKTMRRTSKALEELTPGVRAVTASTQAKREDGLILVDASGGARTVTLPPASSMRRSPPLMVKKTDSSANAVIVAATSGETVDGGASVSLTTQYASLSF